jgi:hypothetical protein
MPRSVLPSESLPISSNLLLASLPPSELAALTPHLRAVDLRHESVLFETDDTIKAVYFPTSAVVSLVVDLATGEMIEAAMIGRDGVVGGSAAFDGRTSLNRAVVQIAGAAWSLDVEHLAPLADRSAPFRCALGRHEQFLMAQA